MIENRPIMYISCLEARLVFGTVGRCLGALGIPCNKCLVDRFGDIGRNASNFCNLLLACRAQTLHRAKMAHNGTFSGGSHARNVVKHRNRHSLIAQLAVERNRKSVGFIANLLDQIKRSGAGR